MYGLGRYPHPETPLAAAAYPVTERADYKITTLTSKYWWEGGVWLDQGQTGTCVGNAFTHRRADSPMPVSGLTETDARELYLDASGDSTYQKGTSGLEACRSMVTEGSISAYHWVTTAAELRNTILTLGPVCIGLNWYNSMFTPKIVAGTGLIIVDKTSGIAGGHEVVINGVNLAPSSGQPFYRLKNSWGLSWPTGAIYGKGTARINCTDLEELIFNENGDAVLVTEV